jgi:C-terminal processing protease CtpA/Prc
LSVETRQYAHIRYSDGGPNGDLISPAVAANRFMGRVYLLTSAGTFSSGMSCATAAKDYGLATIVGEETGEPVVSAGELFEFHTPNVGLLVFLTTKIL